MVRLIHNSHMLWEDQQQCLHLVGRKPLRNELGKCRCPNKPRKQKNLFHHIWKTFRGYSIIQNYTNIVIIVTLILYLCKSLMAYRIPKSTKIFPCITFSLCSIVKFSIHFIQKEQCYCTTYRIWDFFCSSLLFFLVVVYSCRQS